MNQFKNILVFIFLSVTIYGLTSVKSVSYCCGKCNKSKTEKPAETEDKNCCKQQKTLEDACPKDNCNEIPCQYFSIDFDWDKSDFGSCIPVMPVLTSYFTAEFLSFFYNTYPEVIHIINPPPLLFSNARQTLSILQILLI